MRLIGAVLVAAFLPPAGRGPGTEAGPVWLEAGGFFDGSRADSSQYSAATWPRASLGAVGSVEVKLGARVDGYWQRRAGFHRRRAGLHGELRPLPQQRHARHRRYLEGPLGRADVARRPIG